MPTPDILAEVKGNLVRVGFAAESQDLVRNASEKMARKGLDLIVANDITAEGSGFGTDTNQVTIIDKSGAAETLPLLSKYEVAHRILDRVVPLLKSRDSPRPSTSSGGLRPAAIPNRPRTRARPPRIGKCHSN